MVVIGQTAVTYNACPLTKDNCLNKIVSVTSLKTIFMPSTIKYMIDESGSKTSAIVPIRTWEKINEDFHKLQNKVNLLVGLKDALVEIKEVKRSGKKLQTLKDFLNESSH